MGMSVACARYRRTDSAVDKDGIAPTTALKSLAAVFRPAIFCDITVTAGVPAILDSHRQWGVMLPYPIGQS